MKKTPLIVSLIIILGSFAGHLFAEMYQGDHFFFLPPLGINPALTGTFAGSIAPVVQICEWTGTSCVLPPIAEFTTTAGRASERIREVPEEELYIVNWNTKGLNRTKTYRIRVLFRIQEEVLIDKELGHVNVIISDVLLALRSKNATIPIKFRIEKGFFPIGEMTPTERAKISPVMLDTFISQEEFEPVEALVNVVDDKLSLPELEGVELLKDYRPTLAKVFVRIYDQGALASLVQSDNIKYLYENRKWHLVQEPWQETIGQDWVQQAGYLGTGTAVVILDDGGETIGGVKLPNGGIIDLSVPAFGGCTGVGTPASCRVLAEMNPASADPYTWAHATYVARRIAQTAPGTGIIAYDVGFGGGIDGIAVLDAIKWVLDNQAEYNIVAVNMSFATEKRFYSTEDCPKGDDDAFQELRQRGIMPIAGAGNDGTWQENNGFSGISHPACSPFVVGVGGSTNETDLMWNGSTRGSNLDLLAPAEQTDGAPGTSISAAIVSGAWAILRAAKPDLSLEDTLELLKTTGHPIDDPYPGTGLTFPRIQLDAALGLNEPHCVFIVQPSDAAANTNISPIVLVQAMDDNNNPLPGTVITISIENNPADGILCSGATVQAISNEQGIAAFPILYIDKPGNGYTLRAEALLLGFWRTFAISNPFSIL